MLVLLLVLVLGLGLGLNAVNNRHVSLLKQDVTVLGLHKALEGVTILHISDLHGAQFGEAQSRVRQLLRYERIHAVCLTGDMVGRSGNVTPLLELLAVLPADVPVYLIAGDDDPAALDGPKPAYARQAEAAGAIWLDSPQYLEMGGRKLWFAPASLYLRNLDAAAFAAQERRQQLVALGPELSDQDARALSLVDYQLDIQQRTQEARSLMSPQDAYVLLSHFPLDAQSIADLHQGEAGQRQAVNFPGQVSLVLAGHWNNGQWRLPLLGAIRVPSGSQGLQGWLPDDQAISGLLTIHGLNQYISPGLGSSGAYPWQPFRLFNRPEMTLLRLSAQVTL